MMESKLSPIYHFMALNLLIQYLWWQETPKNCAMCIDMGEFDL